MGGTAPVLGRHAAAPGGRRADASARPAARSARYTRDRLVEQAVALAGSAGVEAVTIGRLADVSGLSRSGVTRHFPTRQALQLETLVRAFDAFARAVPLPVAARPAGTERLLAVCERWTDYLAHTAFPGAAVLGAATVGPGAPDRAVLDAVRGMLQRWLRLLADEVRTAVELGQLRPDADPETLAYELHALGMAADQSRRMLGDDSAPARSLLLMRRAVLAYAAPAAAP